MLVKFIFRCAFLLMIFNWTASAQKKAVTFCGSPQNDLYLLLKGEGYKINRHNEMASAIRAASVGSAMFVVSDAYPKVLNTNRLTAPLLEMAKKKKLRLFIEYPASFPGLKINPVPLETRLERGVVTSDVFGKKLAPMSLLGIHNCHILPVDVKDPLIVLAKVVGFDKAEYGLDSTKFYPLLFEKDNALIAMTGLSNFAKARYGPNESIKQVWTYILSKMLKEPNLKINHWFSSVSPMYGKNEVLPANARLKSIKKGVEWFDNGRFFVHPEWKALWLKYQGNGVMPVGPPLPAGMPNGDGTLGIIEGPMSSINFDGSQQSRYWMRADVQGEASMALAAAGKVLNNADYKKKAANLIDFMLSSNMRSGAKADEKSAAFGFIGWSVTQPGTFYGDDNARAILGMIAAAGYLESDKWNKEIADAIMANFRASGKYGFSGDKIEESDLLKQGWKAFSDRELINPYPHFESWMWASYLWLYDKTKYEPLLERTKTAIKLTMDAYPSKWLWGSSMQTQRARMILPLAWLLKIENTEEHRRWLDLMVADLLKAQVESGGIQEEIGAGKGQFRELKSNADYGTDESHLVFKNGDPVAEMLYTCNFALFGLNEAAHVTNDPKYWSAVKKLSDFLIRIQVKSEKHKDVDGAWFRAFEYDRWDYWASNADAGWGAWSTLTGWTQSWIVASQVHILEKQSYWDLTRNSGIKSVMDNTLTIMSK